MSDVTKRLEALKARLQEAEVRVRVLRLEIEKLTHPPRPAGMGA